MFNVITVTIDKPLYGNYVYIRDKILNEAIRKDALLEIKIPAGSAYVDPKEWKKKGKKMEKVFKIANKPMILYGGNVPLKITEEPKKIKKEEKIEDLQDKLF